MLRAFLRKPNFTANIGSDGPMICSIPAAILARMSGLLVASLLA